MQDKLRNLLRPMRQLHRPASISELLTHIEEASSAQQLTNAINRLQTRLWKLSSTEQLLPRQRLTALLILHVLHAPEVSLRLEAANWLRLLIQAGLVTSPEKIFVTFVTAAVRSSKTGTPEIPVELSSYLKMIFDSFWPFRAPSPAYGCELFPANEVFYPLAPLFSFSDIEMQEWLIAIFSELPALDDAEIVEHLLPAALAWSNSADPERRRRVTTILARVNHLKAREALCRLQSDQHPLVSTSAKQAAASSIPGL